MRGFCGMVARSTLLPTRMGGQYTMTANRCGGGRTGCDGIRLIRCCSTWTAPCSTPTMTTSSGRSCCPAATPSAAGSTWSRPRPCSRPCSAAARARSTGIASPTGAASSISTSACSSARSRTSSPSTRLRSLRAAGRRTLRVSNAHNKSLALKLEHTRLDDELDAIVSAHDIGYPKEDTSFWQHLAGREPFDPARTLLIDDNLSVLRAAREYGIRHLLAILQPDSRRPPRDIVEFAAVRGFDELLAQL